jgi:type VI secretion system protein
MRQYAPFVVACVVAASCVIPVRTTHVRLQVQVAPDANDNRPIPVDVVFAWDDEMVAKLETLPAADWFKQKAQLQQDDPQERAISVRGWEWVPGQVVPDVELAVRPGARKWLRAIFVFADYRTEGPHRIRLTPGASAVALLRDEVRLTPVAGGTSSLAEP